MYIWISATFFNAFLGYHFSFQSALKTHNILFAKSNACDKKREKDAQCSQRFIEITDAKISHFLLNVFLILFLFLVSFSFSLVPLPIIGDIFPYRI